MFKHDNNLTGIYRRFNLSAAGHKAGILNGSRAKLLVFTGPRVWSAAGVFGPSALPHQLFRASSRRLSSFQRPIPALSGTAGTCMMLQRLMCTSAALSTVMPAALLVIVQSVTVTGPCSIVSPPNEALRMTIALACVLAPSVRADRLVVRGWRRAPMLSSTAFVIREPLDRSITAASVR